MIALYNLAYRHLITKVDAEQAHELALRAIGVMGRNELTRRLVKGIWGQGAPNPIPPAPGGPLPRPIASPVGLAAGMDKNATAILGLDALGFGFVEIGTVTAHAQPGNPRPRAWRHPRIGALRNQMGFNNDGAEVVASRLRELRSTKAGRGVVVGVNIGKSKRTPAQDAAQDYATSARLLARWSDFLVINVSSPNTPGLRDLQAVDQLRPILVAARDAAHQAAGRPLPVLVKVAPDLADADVDAIADLVVELGLDGVSATNTTIRHTFGPGGLSGTPLRGRAREVVARLRQRLGPKPLIIGMGGVKSVDDVRALQAAGADLVQVYTGFVEQGPTWPGQLSRQA